VISMSDLLIWLSAQTGITETALAWIGSTVIFPFLGWLMKEIEWKEYERAVYVAVYAFGQGVNDAILKVKGLGYVWENWLEPFVIKFIAGIFRVIAQIPMAFTAGLNSRGESLVEK
jgi:hypothetical protein